MSTDLWVARNKGTEQQIETTILGYVGLTLRILHLLVASIFPVFGFGSWVSGSGIGVFRVLGLRV